MIGTETLMEGLAIIVSVLILPLSFASLVIMYVCRPSALARVGLGGREIGLLIVGATFSFADAIPILIHKGTLIMINMGGAIVPIVISIKLWVYDLKEEQRKKLRLVLGLAAIALTSTITYKITKFDPQIGVYSEFPYYLIAMISPPLISLIFVKRESIARYSYISGTFGAVIGADFIRIPQIVSESTSGINTGIIGGAGVMDMVYLSGIVALCITILFVKARPTAEKRTVIGEYKKARMLTMRAEVYLSRGEYLKAVEYSEKASKCINEIINRILFLTGDNKICPRTLNDVVLIHNIYEDGKKSQQIGPLAATKCVYTAKVLLEKTKGYLDAMLASPGKRVLAYILDSIIIACVGIITAYFVYTITPKEFLSFEDRIILFLVLLTVYTYAFHIAYFTSFEWALGKTPGKSLLHIRVLSDNAERADFIRIFARNVCRAADWMLFFYLLAIYLISATPTKQRIGDLIGGTIVVDESGLGELISTFWAFNKTTVSKSSTWAP